MKDNMSHRYSKYCFGVKLSFVIFQCELHDMFQPCVKILQSSAVTQITLGGLVMHCFVACFL